MLLKQKNDIAPVGGDIMPKKYKYTKYFTCDGHRYVVRADSMEELYEKKANKIRDLVEGKVILSGSTTVAEWTNKAFETYKTNVSPAVLKNQLYRVNKNILSIIGHVPLKSIKPIQCQEILNNQIGMSWSQVRAIKQDLNFIFSTALKNKLILENPAADLVTPKSYKHSRRSITRYEREHMLRVFAKSNKYRVFELMLYCGCRSEEAINAEGRDIIVKDGKYLLHIRGTKTANADRLVPISKRMPREVLAELLNVPKFAPLAPNSAGRKHSESSYKRMTAKFKREVNIEMGCRVYRNQLVPPLPLADDFVPYDFRHTYCTDLQRDHVDIRIAQKLMGHSSIDMTANIYTNLDEDDILDAADLIGASVKGVAEGVAQQ